MESKNDRSLMPIGAKIPAELYEKLQDYKAERAIKSDSEAIRTILREFLLDIWPKERAELKEVTTNA